MKILSKWCAFQWLAGNDVAIILFVCSIGASELVH